MVEKKLDKVDVSDHTPLLKEALVPLLRLYLSSTTFYCMGLCTSRSLKNMGSPVSVVVVNIVMVDLALSTSLVPTHILEVDVLSVVPADQVDGMLSHINSINHNIQLTSEREGPFLDVTIMHNNDSLYQSVP